MVPYETIFKGATRPAMKFGVPLTPLVLLCGVGMLAMLWGGLLVSWWVALGALVAMIPALGWMRFVTGKDDQRFRQVFLAVKLATANRNRQLWCSRSYSPWALRGAKESWRA